MELFCLFFFFGMSFSAVSNIVLFVFSHNSFASSSFSISSLSRISNLFFISTLYSGVIPLQSCTFILSPVFSVSSVLFSMLLPIVHDRFRSLHLALFSHLLSCFSIFCLSVCSQSGSYASRQVMSRYNAFQILSANKKTIFCLTVL